MAVVQVACIHCYQTESVVKNGKADSGHQRYLCHSCKKSFQLAYTYNANQPGTHDRIIDMTINGSGVRDIGRVLQDHDPTTVIAHLKNSPLQRSRRCHSSNARIEILCEMDEQWSFVGNKKQQRWLFYAWEPRFKKVIAHALGSRTIETLKLLLKQLFTPITSAFTVQDDWKPYTNIYARR